jgi:hypothetical protein
VRVAAPSIRDRPSMALIIFFIGDLLVVFDDPGAVA